MSIIKINNLVKSYRKDDTKISIINDLTIQFDKNKIYAITGESGVGKTTFLLCISSLCDIDKGIININDKNVNELTDDEISLIRNKEIGIVFQEYNLLPNLTAIENVLVPLLINNNVDFNTKQEKCMECLKYVGLSKQKNNFIFELSGGQKQRLAIARALVNDPSVILADEPTGNLDKKNKKIIIDLFRKIADEGKCVIIVTHDDEILEYVDEVYELKEGKLIRNEK